MNAQNVALPRRIRVRLQAEKVLHTVRSLARVADRVFLTGHGLREMLGTVETDVYVGTASWITRDDIIDDPRRTADDGSVSLCAAARLEPMKGIHLVIDAVRWLRDRAQLEAPGVTLEIFGEGAEREALAERAESLGVFDAVHFGGTYAYPGPFYEAIRRHDIQLITNLNVEQPRIVFDAISQGVVPFCSNSVRYRKLGVPTRVLYPTGESESLAQIVQSLLTSKARAEVMPALRELARQNTLESMHERRAQWVQNVLDGTRRPN
ncbi:MAG: glycosyltransferase [bacterium]|nr:glycosyltransferase [bacterium]